MDIPSSTCFKDVHGDIELPNFSMETLETYLNLVEKRIRRIDSKSKNLYQETFLLHVRYAKTEEIWNSKDREELLSTLGCLFIQQQCTKEICEEFLVIIPEILERSRNIIVQDGEIDFIRHQWFCIALGRTLSFSSEVRKFAIEYVCNSPPFFEDNTEINGEPTSKRAKKVKVRKPERLDIVKAIYKLVREIPNELKSKWNFSSFTKFVDDKNVEIRWLALECLACIVGVTASQRERMRSAHFTQQQILDFTLRYDDSTAQNQEKSKLLVSECQFESEGPQSRRSHTIKSITEGDFCENIATVCGILLPKLQVPSTKDNNNHVDATHTDNLVLVSSTQENLHSLALAVASERPVLLVGPVGSGKTTLVEHLATVTGRGKTPHLIKIQLGDQTDSKALLGTYQCTEVPGEFIWQAGSLTRAVMEGHWILLEDLDYAPMDVVSMLVPLLESGSLSLPGHGGIVRAHPGFRIFATQRLLSSASGLYQQHSAGTDILHNLWTKIVVQPLSKEELKQVMVSLYPGLSTVVERLLDIYLLLSAGKHGLQYDMEASSSAHLTDIGKFMSHEGRLISTRDLMKWVKRIATDFDVTSSSAGGMVFQEALDCFCCCIAKSEKRLPLSEAMAAKLNITKSTAEYYLCKHKPHIEFTPDQFKVGRIIIPRTEDTRTSLKCQSAKFAFTRQSVCLLERVSVCVSQNEPVLLVGETGVGKTSSVQYLAEKVGQRLKVINMNQQSDSSDLLGGFKPVDLRFVLMPFKEDFELLFCKSFSRKQNVKFFGHLQDAFAKRRWSDLLKLMEHTQKSAVKKYEPDSEQYNEWFKIGRRLRNLKKQVKQTSSSLAFSFIEGTLVKALKAGQWVLLDEINLASAETLECLSGLLESTAGSVVLMERGDTNPIVRHPDFRLFACMNPATDVGKKDLPPGLRNRFTELYVDELEEPQELKILVAEYLKGLSLTSTQIDGIVKFYCVIRNETVKKLSDGTGRKPHYSLRTLCRALRQAAPNPHQNVLRSLYEAFCLSFLTQLDRSSHPIVEQLICQHIIGKNNYKTLLKHSLPEPMKGGRHVSFEGFWVAQGKQKPEVPDGYVLTPSVRANLRDLTRVVSAGRYPVLIQGETSVGKTSLVNWLAKSSGNVCVRINNHEHTDLQEYIGCYAADQTGKLVFQEGVLVEAMRKGQWIILDELNLAPTDVLEALNRLLDDNRELFIAETQETVQAHPKFMLFATQNPPGQYGGRKVLSRAFRNRFVELHFDEIPSKELETILHQRCRLPLSHCKKLVAIMLELQTHRRSTGVFAGKSGFITLRDLFRWAERYSKASASTNEKFYDWDQLLADNGYMLLAGRVRKPDECDVIVKVIEKHLKRKVSPHSLFSIHEKTSPTTRQLLESVVASPCAGFEHVVWTQSMRRMAVLVGQALTFGEPVLLVGDTGCGKTTVCQIYAALKQQQLHGVNCHLHTEGSDFLGGLRPARDHSQNTEEGIKLFEWCDGPLVLAMKEGTMFLIDEISLADDSVLERLNSVLEPERTLLLSEKGAAVDSDLSQVEQVVARDAFRIVATMNPGGDYGKKELSPALRNRFTEIWCPLNQDRDDHVMIIEHNLRPQLGMKRQSDGSTGFGQAMMDFVTWFRNNEVGKRVTISIRDLLSWVGFMNASSRSKATLPDQDVLDPARAYVHGACLVFLDALGSGLSSSVGTAACQSSREMALRYLVKQMKELTGKDISQSIMGMMSQEREMVKQEVQVTDSRFRIEPFSILRGPQSLPSMNDYALNAPTTCMNAVRVLRALQLPRAILLEGSPGVGKTSLVAAIAKAAGHQLQRINLSEQTDVSDLFGADLPVEGGEGGQFAWRDGPLLQALKAGHWIVLDELNLASQSVLEGLNACLDHRAEIYVPELGRSFRVEHEKTRLFACQNPLNQGGGRKGLPRSFLNRFTQVYVEPHTRADLQFITGTIYPQLPAEMLADMIDFNQQVTEELSHKGSWGQKGSPWEFNLRDIFRWCDLLLQNQAPNAYNPGDYVHLIYADRMRSPDDKHNMLKLFTSQFADKYKSHSFNGEYSITPEHIQVGNAILKRKEEMTSAVAGSRSKRNSERTVLLHGMLAPLESLIKCIGMNWMSILIGGSGSGKTSLVHVLAQLAHVTLHVLPMNSAMDTIELLGGFEQADIGRHIEEVSALCSALVYRVIAHLITLPQKSAMSDATKLLEAWHKYLEQTQHKTGDTLTHQEEVDVFERKVQLLQQVMTDLVNLGSGSTICDQDHQKYFTKIYKEASSVTSCLEDLASKVSQLKTSRQSGCFEWVDSVLVTALQRGHWLMIDNVNFCSPSVLDRLNALLEPGGVLSVTERGVIDGQVPTVAPHPDFRLILTMDPKHGEISRAMRNRGVEIYVCGETDKVMYSDHDIKSMLHSAGLAGKVPCETLLTLHRCINASEQFRVGYSLVDLLRVAGLVESRLQRGTGVTPALRQACMEVYARPLLDTQARQFVMGQIEDHISQLNEETLQSANLDYFLSEPGLWPDARPSVEEWRASPALASVQNHCVLFAHLLQLIALDASNRGTASLNNEEQTSMTSNLPFPREKVIAYLRYMVKHMISTAPVNTWPLLKKWLLSLISSRLSKQNVAIKYDGVNENEWYLAQLAKIVELVLPYVLTHPQRLSLTKLVQEALGGNKVDDLVLYQPYDLRWKPSLLDQLHMVQSRQHEESMDTGDSSQSKAMANRLQLLQHVKTLSILNEHGVTREECTVKKLKRGELSPLQISFGITQDLAVDILHLDHKCFVHLHSFVCEIDQELLQIIGDASQEMTDIEYVKTLQALTWYERFVWLCHQPMKSHDKGEFAPTASLYWQWLYEHLLTPLLDRFTVKLKSIINQMHTCLGSDQDLCRLYEALWKKHGHPSPFRSRDVAKAVTSLICVCDRLSISDSHSEILEKHQRKVALWQHRGAEVRHVLTTALTAARADHGDEDSALRLLQEATHTVTSLCDEFDIPAKAPASSTDSISHTQMDTNCDKTSAVEHQQVDLTVVQLWPLYDLCAISTELSVLGEFVKTLPPCQDSNDVTFDARLKACLGFVKEYGTSDASSVVPWSLVCGFDSERQHGQRDSVILNTLARLAHGQSSLHDPQHWLTWAPPTAAEQEYEIADKKQSQALEFINGASISEICFGLFIGSNIGSNSGANSSKLKDDGNSVWSPSNVTLAGMTPKLEQLQIVTNQLTRQVGLFASADWLQRCNLFSVSSQSLLLHLQHLVSMVDDSQRTDCSSATNKAVSLTKSEAPSSCSTITECAALLEGCSSFDCLIPGCDELVKETVMAFKECQASIRDEKRAADPLLQMIHVGRLMTLVGVLQCHVLAPQGPVDPVEKLRVQLEYANNKRENICDELHVLNWNNELICGQPLDLADDSLHPHVRHLVDKKQDLETQIDTLSEQVAYRPQPSQYGKLLQESKQFLITVGSKQRVKDLLNKLRNLWKDLQSASFSKHKSVLKEVESWSSTVSQFMKRVEEQFMLYKDITVPFLAGVPQIQTGIGLISCGIKKLLHRHAIPNYRLLSTTSPSLLEDCLTAFCAFPYISKNTTNSLEMAFDLVDKDSGILKQIMQMRDEEGEKKPSGSNFSVKVMKSALRLIENHALLKGKLDVVTLDIFSRVLAQFVIAWQQAEEDRKLKALEKESLYKYKEQSHGEELKEDEKDAAEIQQMFPSFDEDFDDIKWLAGATLDDAPKPTRVENSNAEDETHMQISDQDMVDIQRSHRVVLNALTSADWKKACVPQSEALVESLSYMEPAMTLYQVASQFMTNASKCLVQDVDARVLGSHLLASTVIQHTVKPEVSVFKRNTQKPFDIYYDPAVSDVLKCRPVLDSFKLRLRELLAEWEGHPTLMELMTVIDRIMAFPVTSPLIKFVTGLEVVIHKAQEWESNAAKYVSLQDHMNNVSHLIIDWRKLELANWRSCLDTVECQCSSKASKWWFFIYGIIESYLSTQPSGDEPAPSTEAVVKSLQQFMEDSPLGEFSARLDLLHSFLCQLVHMETSHKQKTLLNILWNMHTYYNQFKVNVGQQIAKQKGPIEKELKAFVKIARWNDVNFYALKQAVEKTHKTLHKHMKEFRLILQQPVKPFLVEEMSDAEEHAHGDDEGRLDKVRVDPQVFVYAGVISTESAFNIQKFLSNAPFSLDANNTLSRLPQLAGRYRKHAASVMKHHSVTSLLEGIEELTGEVITNVHELSKLDVAAIEDKKKAKAQAKHIQLRKRKALSDLFRYLQHIGLSYRKGLLMTQSDTLSQLQQPPIAVDVTLGGAIRDGCAETTLRVWEGCQKYQTRCIARHAVLNAALVTPSKELGPSNIERCKGFSQHLLELTSAQWKSLAQHWTHFVQLRKSLATLQGVCQAEQVYSQDKLRMLLEDTQTCINTALEFLLQFSIILQCWPQNSGNICNGSPVTDSQIALLFRTTQESELWKETSRKISELKTALLKLKEEYSASQNDWLDAEHVTYLERTSGVLVRASNTMKGIHHTMRVETNEAENCFSSGVAFVQAVLDDMIADIKNFQSSNGSPKMAVSQSDSHSESPSDERISDITSDLICDTEHVVTSAMLVVQDLLKVQKENLEDTEKENGEHGQVVEDETGLLKNLMTDHLFGTLKSATTKLRLMEITNKLQKMNNHARTLSNSENCTGTFQSLQHILQKAYPVLQQYAHLAQYLLTNQIAAFRSSAKLLSVLQGVFSELARKGFCLPAEYSDEMAGEGATQFEDIEGGGLGDGEGTKDVSDQIETEDQLDEARKAGADKKEEDHDEEPDIQGEDNAIEMTDDMEAKMHDVPKEEGDENDSEDDGDDDTELDKQMGDLGDDSQTDKLDEQVWGSDNEEDEEKTDKKEEVGAGAGQEGPSELGAKDDVEESKMEKQEKEQQQQLEDDKEQVNEMDKDEREYNENEETDKHNEGDDKQELPPEIDLPNDLDLDQVKDDEDDKEEGDDMGEENPFDIDKVNPEDMKDVDDSQNPDETDTAEAKETEGDENNEEDNDGEETEKKEPVDEMETEQEQGEEGEDQTEQETPPGFEPKDDRVDNVEEEKREEEEEQNKPDNIPQSADLAGKTSHDTQEVQQVDQAKDAAGTSENQQKESEGTGMAESQEESHPGEEQSRVTKGSQSDTRQQRRQKPGQSSENRTLGSEDEKINRRLETVDTNSSNQDQANEEQKQESDLYEHIQDDSTAHDAQTMDVASADQKPADVEEAMDIDEQDDNVAPQADQEEKEVEKVDQMTANKMKASSDQSKQDKEKKMDQENDQDELTHMEVEGEKIATIGASRGMDSSIYTTVEHMGFNAGDLDIEQLRESLESTLADWKEERSAISETEAQQAWQQYEVMTASLAQDLCEQLRLVLEPSQASKLKGDYRTGKRLNMRKVIPYIASQFRKDKIWLRRTKPSKRNYQIMVAVDDSSSMADNHSKQLAFESLATISNALTLLEVGQLAVASFGEQVRVLHDFHEQFSSHSGASLLQRFTFEQKKTKIAQLLKHMTVVMTEARSRQHGTHQHPETSQLLLIVSDGRGLFLEGTEVVKMAVRQAREANIFLAFVILDSPTNKDSILDIKVPVFRGGNQLPEIKSYMENFPFPFYMLLRDINCLPSTLSDALRQWFELVTATDR